jgi:S-adenosylmethionine hydrolase
LSGLITLLTDFGWDDPYLAEVKGVILTTWQKLGGNRPWPQLVDLVHTLPPGEVTVAEWFLHRVHGTFPAGTVHMAVVDPGVGTTRPLVAAAARGQFFLGPGNGLFRFLARQPNLAVVQLDDPRFWRDEGLFEPAPTFHGRDIMAPVAARLAWGVPLAQLGSVGSVADLTRGSVSLEPPEKKAPLQDFPAGMAGQTSDLRIGTVVWTDRFGNALTDVGRATPLGRQLDAGATVKLGPTELEGPFLTFSHGPAERPFWYWGSGGTLEAALRGGDGARRYDWKPGLAVTLAASLA